MRQVLVCLAGVCVLFWTGPHGWSQSTEGPPAADSRPPQLDSLDDVPAILTSLAPFVLLKGIADCVLLKEYVRGEEFARFRARRGDLAAIDAIFRRAMKLSWNHPHLALLLSLVATIDHRSFGVRVPLLGPVIWVPLSSEFEEDFRSRVDALPERLYPDTPPCCGGDRDKLQHFFGSAFLALAFESRETAERVGNFIEWGEEKFVVGGALDERDIRANRQGQEFGLRLREDPGALPSPFLRFQLAEGPRFFLPRGIPADSLHPALEGR